MTEIEELRAVIHKLHGGETTHRESVPVKEVWKGQTVWDGTVEVFDLYGHPKTNRVYAWSHGTDDKGKRYVTVLHIPPAVSPILAVRTALLQEYRDAQRTQA